MEGAASRGLLWVAVAGFTLQVGIAVVGGMAYFGANSSRTDVLSTQMTELRDTVRSGLADIRVQIANIPSDHAQLQQVQRAVVDLQPRVTTLEQQMFQTRTQLGLDRPTPK